jgi:hypothetical protein
MLRFLRLMLLLALFVPTPSGAETNAFRYVDSNTGALAYTDDLDRVPPAQRGQATAVTLGDLSDFTRYTPMSLDEPVEDVCKLVGECFRVGVVPDPDTGEPVGVAFCPATGAMIFVPLTPATPTSFTSAAGAPL